MLDSNQSNIQNFYNFFGGFPDEVMKCEHIPCKEVMSQINTLTVSMAILPLLEYVKSEWSEKNHFVEFQKRNGQLLSTWTDILKSRIEKLEPTDERILYRYDLITTPDTFIVELRMAAIPTLRGVILAAWSVMRFNDEQKKPLMISPSISILGTRKDLTEEDAELIRLAVTDSKELNGDAGRSLEYMFKMLNKPRLLS